MAIECVRTELERLLHDLGSKYIMEIVYTNGKVRREVIDEGLLRAIKFRYDRKDFPPKAVKTIKYYKICLRIDKIGSRIIVDPYLEEFGLSELPPEPSIKLTEKGRRMLENQREETRKK